MPDTPRWTIGELARRGGISAGTLRHYHRLGLLHPTSTSGGGYRIYTERDRARLDLIRALRGLELDLPTIGRLLRGATTVRAVAELHLRALDHQARALERRRAVLRVLLRDGRAPTAERLTRLHALAGFEQLDRARFLGEQLDERLRETPATPLQRAIRDVATIDLPVEPSEAQVEAWLELAELVSDPTFLARYRGANAPNGPRDPARFRRELDTLYGPAARAARDGIDPTSAEGRPIVRAWLRGFARMQGRPLGAGARVTPALARETRRTIEAYQDAREMRFWALIGVLKPEMARSNVSVAWPWLMAALQAFGA